MGGSIVRTVAGIVAGLVIWIVGFYAIGMIFGLIWPAYAEAARFMFREDDLSHFTTPMLFLNWVLFVGTGSLTGWLASWIAKNRVAPLVVAGLWFVYAVVNHYWLVWNELPDWYNVIVPFVIGLPIFAWSRFAKAPARAAAAR
jgi:hypothetical protein